MADQNQNPRPPEDDVNAFIKAVRSVQPFAKEDDLSDVKFELPEAVKAADERRIETRAKSASAEDLAAGHKVWFQSNDEAQVKTAMRQYTFEGPDGSPRDPDVYRMARFVHTADGRFAIDNAAIVTRPQPGALVERIQTFDDEAAGLDMWQQYVKQAGLKSYTYHNEKQIYDQPPVYRVEAIGAKNEPARDQGAEAFPKPVAYSEVRMTAYEMVEAGDPPFALVERFKTAEMQNPTHRIMERFEHEEVATQAFENIRRQGYTHDMNTAIHNRIARNEFVEAERQADPIDRYLQYRVQAAERENLHSPTFNRMEVEAGSDRMAVRIATDPALMAKAGESLGAEVTERACRAKIHHLEPAEIALLERVAPSFQQTCSTGSTDSNSRLGAGKGTRTEVSGGELIDRTYAAAYRYQSADPVHQRAIEARAIEAIRSAPTHQRAELAMSGFRGAGEAADLSNQGEAMLHQTVARWERTASDQLGTTANVVKLETVRELRDSNRAAEVIRAIDGAAQRQQRGEHAGRWPELTKDEREAQDRFIANNPGILRDPNTGFAPNGALIDKRIPLEVYAQSRGISVDGKPLETPPVAPSVPSKFDLQQAYKRADELTERYGNINHPAVQRELRAVAAEVLKSESQPGSGPATWTPERDAEIREKIGAKPATKLISHQIDQLKAGREIEKDPVAEYARVRRAWLEAETQKDFDPSAAARAMGLKNQAIKIAQQVENDPGLVARAITAKEAEHMGTLLQRQGHPVQNLPVKGGRSRNNDIGPSM